MQVQNGDKLSYATITIGSHGFDIRMNPLAHFEAELSSVGVELLRINAQNNNIIIAPDEMEKMIFDPRAKGGSLQSFVVVFRSGKTEEEILNLIHPQLKMWVARYKAMYENLLANASEMLEVLEKGPTKQHLCPIKKEEE